MLYKDPTLVKGVSFDSWRRVGYVLQQIKVYNLREVDELMFLDISATSESREPLYQLIDDFADECFVPLTVGGGINDLQHIRKLLSVGADKVAINSAAVYNPELVKAASDRYGSQCIVVSIDFKKNAKNEYEVYTHSGSKPTGLNPIDFAKKMEEQGAGEILLTSIDLDGTFNGYDLELSKIISENLSIPVIVSGGAGNYDHMLQVLQQTKASAVAAASIFHFTEQTPLEAKKFLKDNGVNTRL